MSRTPTAESSESAAADLARQVRDARARTLALVEDLPDPALLGPRLPTVNPRLWEVGHVAWFQEWWCLRRGGRASVLPAADALFDSARIAHDVRWDLPLPSREDVLRYLGSVEDAVLERLADPRVDPRDLYYVRLSVFHEDMHDESLTWTRQALSDPPPPFALDPEAEPRSERGADAPAGDAWIEGGTYEIGASPYDGFVFDNEKWAHPVEVRGFSIARGATTEAEFAAFVDDGGYRRREWWTEEGWAWREAARAEHPHTWRREGASWSRREFDRWRPLAPRRPVMHVNAYEAEAYARWAGRRLPTEAEWEVAAAGGAARRPRPWGDAAPTPAHANLDGRLLGCVDVDALAAGDSAHGVRQAWGNVWEWTSTPFGPYPGFVVDPYVEYSKPWFGTHRVLRGGCFATRARLLRSTWRNFFTPDRRDVFAGFRTCAASAAATR